MNFSEALVCMKRGGKVFRSEWGCLDCGQQPGGSEHIGIYEIPKSTAWADFSRLQPYLYHSSDDGCLIPWAAPHGDILADDWEVVTDRSIEAKLRSVLSNVPDDVSEVVVFVPKKEQ